MPTEQDFLPFAAGSGANVLSQSAYAALSAIANGYSSGVAQSAAVNKTLRQSSIMAAVLAQFIVDQSGQPAIDDGTTTTLEANLLAAIRNAAKMGVILADTGAANTYTAVNVPALVSGTWADGVVQKVKIAHANTSASTYAPDGLTAIPIYGLGLQPLQGGELALNGTAVLMHATIAGVNSGNPIAVLMECAGGAQQIPLGSYGVTPPQFDASTKAATMAALARMGMQSSGFTLYSSSATLPLSVVGGTVQVVNNTGPVTLTLPLTSAIAPAVGRIEFVNSSTYPATIAKQGADSLYTVNGSVASSGIVLQPNDTLTVECQGAGVWISVGGSALLGFSFASSNSASGYQKLPSGLIMQWGQATSNGSGDATITFPIAFPTATLQVYGTPNASVAQTYSVNSYTPTVTGFLAKTTTGNVGTSLSFSWLAFGK